MVFAFSSLRISAAAPTLGHEARPCPGLLREEVGELVTVLDSDASDIATRNHTEAAISAVVGETRALVALMSGDRHPTQATALGNLGSVTALTRTFTALHSKRPSSSDGGPAITTRHRRGFCWPGFFLFFFFPLLLLLHSSTALPCLPVPLPTSSSFTVTT